MRFQIITGILNSKICITFNSVFQSVIRKNFACPKNYLDVTKNQNMDPGYQLQTESYIPINSITMKVLKKIIRAWGSGWESIGNYSLGNQTPIFRLQNGLCLTSKT